MHNRPEGRNPRLLLCLAAALLAFVVQSGELGSADTMHRLQTAHSFWTSEPAVFPNEYPEFGGDFEVYHHSQYLSKLVDEGRLPSIALSDKSDKKITFHDPCYLGRQNGEYNAPRQLVQLSVKSPIAEMEQSREKGFCCGGGGGMTFIEEPSDKRVNRERARQVLETGADVVAVGCPFCMTMMEDGVNAIKGDRDIRVMDLSELLWEASKASVARKQTKTI